MTTPIKDEAPELAGIEGFKDQTKTNNSNCEPQPMSAQALKVIEGEHKAMEFLGRLGAQQADSHELGVILSMLYGPTLRGFCSVLVKALEVPNG